MTRTVENKKEKGDRYSESLCNCPTILLDKPRREAEVIKKDSLDWRVVLWVDTELVAKQILSST